MNWLEQSQSRVQTKLLLLNQQREAIKAKASILMRLCRCFKDSQANSLAEFWNHFKDKKDFEALLDVLVLEEKEKEGWRRAYQYQFNSDSGFWTRVGTYFKGTKITTLLLKEKASKAAGSLFHFLLDEHVTQIDKEKKLKHLVQYYEQEGLQVALLKVEGFINMLSMSHPCELTLPEKSGTEPKADVVLSLEKQMKVYTLLKEIVVGIEAIYRRLCIDRDNTLLLQEGIMQLKAFIRDNSLMLKREEIEKGLLLCDKTLRERYQAIVKEKEKKIISLEEVKDCYQQHFAKLQAVKETFDTAINALERRGKHERLKALEELVRFINKRKGIWEWICQCLSPTYKRGMREISGLLKDKDEARLATLEQIAQTLHKTKKDTVFFIKYRVKDFYRLGGGVFFGSSIRQNTSLELRDSLVPVQTCRPNRCSGNMH